jgi:hypothetical protein
LLVELDVVFVTFDWIEAEASPFLDLMVVGQVDQAYIHDLIQKVEL